VGAFPGLQRPRVLFLHLGNDDPSGGGDPLAQLAADVRRAVDAAWREGPQDHKPFRPHLTLARIKRPPGAAALAALRSLELGPLPGFEVATVELMASELRPEGARHTVVETLRLAG
jgi:2'-5' RNA ligase